LMIIFNQKPTLEKQKIKFNLKK